MDKEDIIEKILIELDEEHKKISSEVDQEKIGRLVQELVDAGIYPSSTPAMIEHGWTHIMMVENWGAYWQIFSEPHYCPHCSTDLRDKALGPPFGRQIIYQPEFSDENQLRCPDCGKNMADEKAIEKDNDPSELKIRIFIKKGPGR